MNRTVENRRAEQPRKMYVPYARSTGNSTYKYINTFKPLEWQVEPWQDTSAIVLLTGSAGGGKSTLAAEKIHAFCLKYPNTMALVVRKTRDSLNNSSVLLLDKAIIGNDPRVVHVRNRRRFEYQNGSVLAYEGMNDENARERIRSMGQHGGLDIVWIEEATELEEEDFNELLARMRGTAAPWRQIILTTNPDGPLHWINQRLILGGEASVYYSKADQNPHNPASYKKSLSGLTGIQRERLVLGRWVLGSGVIFDTWLDDYNPHNNKSTGNVTLEAEFIPGGGKVIWGIDDGYSGKFDRKKRVFTSGSHPRAILVAQIRSNGIVSIIDEDYAVEVLAVDHIRSTLARLKTPKPQFVVRDRAAASLDGACHKLGLTPRYNHVPVDESIKELRTWLAPDHNDVRKVIVHPRCRYLRYQMSQYSMDKKGKIIKDHDDGCDSLRYIVWDRAYGVNPSVDIATWDMVANKYA